MNVHKPSDNRIPILLQTAYFHLVCELRSFAFVIAAKSSVERKINAKFFFLISAKMSRRKRNRTEFKWNFRAECFLSRSLALCDRSHVEQIRSYKSNEAPCTDNDYFIDEFLLLDVDSFNANNRQFCRFLSTSIWLSINNKFSLNSWLLSFYSLASFVAHFVHIVVWPLSVDGVVWKSHLCSTRELLAKSNHRMMFGKLKHKTSKNIRPIASFKGSNEFRFLSSTRTPKWISFELIFDANELKWRR